MEKKENVLEKYKQAVVNKEECGFLSRLREAYDYCCPRRCSVSSDGGKPFDIFDSSAIYAVQSRASANHEALFPAFREWIEETPVNQLEESAGISIAKQLKSRKNKAHKAIELSNFHVEIEDVITDTLFSDGALLVFRGTPEQPLRFQAVDWENFYSLNDMDGEPTNNFLQRKLNLATIRYKWPEADLSSFSGADEKKEMDCMDCYTYDNHSRKYTYSLFIGEKCVLQKEEDTSPWVVFNQKRRGKYKTGWGQVLDAMPDIKTVNKVVHLQLANASVNQAGIWQADDDGVLNLDNISLVPGAVIPKAVGSNGLQPLKTNTDIGLDKFIISELRDNIKKSVQGSALPDFSQGVRSAAEYQMRDAEIKKTELPAMMQLAQGAKRLMRRIFEILESDAMKTSAMYCPKVKDRNGGIVVTAFTSPLIRLKDQLELNSNLQLMAAAAGIFGQAAYEIIDTDKFLRDFYLKNGFTDIRDEDDVEKYREQNKQKDIELAQAGVKQAKPVPGNVRL